MNRIRITGIILVLGLLLVQVPVAAAQVTASPTNAALLVDGRAVTFQAYNLENNNYFQIRALADALKDTAKAFHVVWDNETRTVRLTSGQPYIEGPPAITNPAVPELALASTAQITLNGQAVNVAAYNIQGNTYFKLRDVMALLDVGVGWDQATRTIRVDTSIGYQDGSTADQVKWLSQDLILVDGFSDGLARVRTQEERFGFVDSTGNLRLPTVYTSAGNFHDGIAVVSTENNRLALNEQGELEAMPRWILIDTQGNVIFDNPDSLEIASEYADGLLLAKNTDNLYGFIDKTGRFVIPAQYPAAAGFYQGVAAVTTQEGVQTYIRPDGSQAYPYALSTQGDKSFLLGQNGMRTQPWGQDTVQVQWIQNGAYLQYTNETKNTAGLIDAATGQVKFEITDASQVSLCSDGMIRVRQDGNGDPLYGYYSLATGTLAIPYQFASAQDFYEGLAVVGTGAAGSFRKGAIDKTGALAVPWEYTHLMPHGPLYIASTDGLKGLMTPDGTWVLPMRYQTIAYKAPGQPTYLIHDGNRYGFYLPN